MHNQLRERLSGLENQSFAAVIGFDGFVDEVVYVVDRRISPTEYTRVNTLREYGQRITDSSGLSSNVEIVPAFQKLGGNGPIFALCLKKYGVDLTYIGCTGSAATHAVFAEMAAGARVVGICDPGQTDAMEFDDGKLIRSKLESLNHLTWETILARLSIEELAGLLDSAKLLSFNNWTMLPYMSDIWEHLLQEVLPLLKSALKEKVLFFDLADPQKRDPADIVHALELIRQFKAVGFNTVLGLNKKEACQVARIAGKDFGDPHTAVLQELAEYVASFMRIDCVVIHPTDRAACVCHGEYSVVKGPYCEKPKLTTGAGDNFNAGFVYGYTMGFSMKQSLLMGVSTSGYYVRNCASPGLEEIRTFLLEWKNGNLC